jgi:hypothetical protein
VASNVVILVQNLLNFYFYYLFIYLLFEGNSFEFEKHMLCVLLSKNVCTKVSVLS